MGYGEEELEDCGFSYGEAVDHWKGEMYSKFVVSISSQMTQCLQDQYGLYISFARASELLLPIYTAYGSASESNVSWGLTTPCEGEHILS